MDSHRDIETEQAHRPTNEAVAVVPEPMQRSARNDPDLRDGDSAHGNPNESAAEDFNDSDRDVGDSAPTGAAMPEEAAMHEHDPEEEAGLAHTRAEFGERNADTHLAPEPTENRSGPGPRDIPNRTIDSPGREQIDEQLRKDFAREAGTAHPTPPGTTPGGGTGAPGEADLPVAYFTKLTVPEIIRKAENLTPDELRTLLDFERAHRNRKTLVAQLERWARGDRRGGRRRAISSDAGGGASS